MPSARRMIRSSSSAFCDRDLALHEVVGSSSRLPRRLQADHRRHARRAPRPGRGRATCHRSAPSASRRAPARASPPVRPGCSSSDRRGPRRAVGARPRRAASARANWWTISPSQSRPSQDSPSMIAATASGGRALPVGVLDAQQERAAVMAGIEPVEQGGAGAADMQKPGRRRREADDYGHTGLNRPGGAAAQRLSVAAVRPASPTPDRHRGAIVAGLRLR